MRMDTDKPKCTQLLRTVYAQCQRVTASCKGQIQTGTKPTNKILYKLSKITSRSEPHHCACQYNPMHQQFLMTREGHTHIRTSPTVGTDTGDLNHKHFFTLLYAGAKVWTGWHWRERDMRTNGFTNSKRQEKGRSELISGIPPRLHRHLITRTRHGSILSSFSPVPSGLLLLTLSHLELWCSFNPITSRFAH